MRLRGLLALAVGMAMAGPPAIGQGPDQPKVQPGPMEPDWSDILQGRYRLRLFDDLANPVKTTVAAVPGLFRKAGPGPVIYTPIIALGLGSTTRGGWYADATDAPAKELWSYTFKNTANDLETGRNLPPPLADGSQTSFDPGVAAFGLWVANDGFEGIVQSEPRRVAAKNPRLARQPYKAMIYPFKDKATGEVIPGSVLIGWEYSTNDDFQDVVCRVDNVTLIESSEGTKATAKSVPARLLFDTDLESDVDDVGAVAVLHALADQGEVTILGMGLSVKHPWSAPCLDALNTYYGRPDLPIGVPKGKAPDSGSKYARSIAEEFPHDPRSAEDAPDVVALYRKLLAAQPDESVVLVSVGFLTNVARLLESPGDETSPSTGVALVRQKVRSWVCMGCGFPNGREWNVFQDAPSSRVALDLWPRPIVFSGFEIGDRIKTGPGLVAAPASSPVRRSYELFNGLADRQSWDQTAVLYAVRGLDGGLDEVWDRHSGGSVEILEDGSNQWRDAPDRGHSYLVRKMPPEEVAKIIATLMVRPPREAAR